MARTLLSSQIEKTMKATNNKTIDQTNQPTNKSTLKQQVKNSAALPLLSVGETRDTLKVREKIARMAEGRETTIERLLTHTQRQLRCRSGFVFRAKCHWATERGVSGTLVSTFTFKLSRWCQEQMIRIS